MKLEKLLFISLLLISTIFISIIFTSFMDLNIFDKSNLGIQYLFFSILASFIYFSYKYLKLLDSSIIVISLSIVYTFLLNKTGLSTNFGGVLGLFLYTFTLFAVFAVIFTVIWFKIKFTRNIIFSILATFGYMLVHLISSIIININISALLILTYFKNGIMIMIVISFGITIAELAFRGITNFYKPPQLHKTE